MFGPRPFLVALQFLTALPVRNNEPPTARAIGYSLLYYPLVGLLIGLLLAVLAWVFNDVPATPTAALLLVVWVALTGALHLDGLADSADAWIGGLGNRARTLAIMKDPCCGPTAVVTLTLVLTVKFTALSQLMLNNQWTALLLAPLLGRTMLVLLFLTTPYVRPHGLGSLLAQQMPRRACALAVIFALIFVLASTQLETLVLLLAVGCIFHMLRRLMLRRLGGTTGDTAGALVEIVESLVLLITALMN